MTLFGGFSLPRRLALGFKPSRTPGLLWITLGLLLGPASSNVIPSAVLARLDPVVSMALAVLGAFVGSGFVTHGRAPASVAGAIGQASVTVLGVAAAMWFLLTQWQMTLAVEVTVAALILGLCSAGSAAIHTQEPASPDMMRAATLADLDDVPIIIAASIAIPWLGVVTDTWITLGVAVGAALTIGVAGLLLLSRADSTAERGVVVTGTLLLLSGAAAYITTSPLTAGLVAGMLWQRQMRAATPTSTHIERLQHPLLALLLIAAGASLQFSWALVWITAPLVLVRLSSKTVGGMLVSPLVRVSPGLASAALVPPGILGIALAFNFQQVLGSGGTILLSAVTVSTMLSEVLARTVLSAEEVA